MQRLILLPSWEVGLQGQPGAENFSRGEKTGTVGAGATTSPGETSTQEVATHIKSRINGGPASQEEEDDVPRARPTVRAAEPSNRSLEQGGKR